MQTGTGESERGGCRWRRRGGGMSEADGETGLTELDEG